MDFKIKRNLEEFKQSKNLTIYAIGKILKLNYQVVKDLLTNNSFKKIKLETVEKVAVGLGLTIDQLLFEDIKFN